MLSIGRDRRELQPHGTPDFPCAVYSDRCSINENEEFPWHWHDDIEIVIIVDGKLYVNIPGKSFTMEKGDSIFINSNLLHHIKTKSFCEIHTIVFHPMLIAGSEHSVFYQRYVKPLTHFTELDCCLCDAGEAWKQEITNLAIHVYEAMVNNTPGYEFSAREFLSQICFSLYQQYAVEAESLKEEQSMDTIRILKMLDFIHKYYMEYINLAQIAHAADIGERECMRCFQRIIQISPLQYMIKYRITQGAYMLKNNKSLSIADIAIKCGFDNPSHFSQTFKRYYRCTPSEYKAVGQ
jgi:AraC-like DNA-binding protein/mannose-6-phosphate isomerase-like protein (cupin superfamily)